VRAALREQRPADARVLLDEYARRFPSGALSPEASVLGVQVLLAAGDRAGAEAAARALIESAPATFAARRARALLNW
jgi:hypothetical protein